jgi:hypothetical protein
MPRLVFAFAILIVSAAAAQYFVGWRSLVYPWSHLDDPFALAIAVILIGATYALRALRLFRYFQLRTGFSSCLRVLLQQTLLINVLPMNAGELAFPALMNRHFGIPLRRSLPALLWLRALDLYALLAIALLAFGMLSGPLLLAAALIWLALPFVAFRLSPTLSPAAEPKRKLERLARDLLAAVPKSTAAFVENWALTVINWALKIAVFALIIDTFSASGYLASLAGAVGGELSAILPIQGFARIGTYEAGVVAAMRPFGIGPAEALTGAVNLHLLFLGVSIVCALLSLLIPKPRLERVSAQVR